MSGERLAKRWWQTVLRRTENLPVVVRPAFRFPPVIARGTPFASCGVGSSFRVCLTSTTLLSQAARNFFDRFYEGSVKQ
jgi:hypothetical protein